MLVVMKMLKERAYKLLRASEKYTHSDMIVLAKDSSWMTVSRIVTISTGLGLTVSLANLLPQDIYGQYKFILSIFGIIVAFSLTGMGTAVVQSVSRGFDKSFLVATKTHLKWSVVMIAIAFGISAYYFIQENKILGISLIIIAIASPLMQSFSLYGAYLQGKRNFKKEAIYGFFYTIVPALILVVTAFLTDSILIMISIYFIGYSTATVLIFFLVKRKIPKESSADLSSNGYGKHLSLMNVLGSISSQVDKILVFHYLGAVQLAIYTISLAAPQQLRHINKLVSTISSTRLPNLSISKIKKVLPRKMIILFLIAVVIVIVYMVLAKPFYSIFFPTYLDAIFYSQIYSLIILFLPVTLLQQTFTAHIKKKELYILQTFMPIIKIGSLVILLPTYGILGALSAIFIAEISRAILISYFYVKLR